MPHNTAPHAVLVFLVLSQAQKREQKFLEKIAREKEERLRLIKEKGPHLQQLVMFDVGVCDALLVAVICTVVAIFVAVVAVCHRCAYCRQRCNCDRGVVLRTEKVRQDETYSNFFRCKREP